MTRNKHHVQGLTLVPYDDGRFEVIVNRTKIYSKLETGVFPDNGEIQARLEKQPA